MTGSIDTYSGFGAGQEFGIDIHHEIQRSRSEEHPSYRSEIWTEHTFSMGHYKFEVTGKIDGIFYQDKVIIEEIKTAFDVNKLLKALTTNADHPYWLQIKTYGYIYWLKNDCKPELNLHLVSSRNKKFHDLKVEFDPDSYQDWLSRRLNELVSAADFTDKLIKKRTKLGMSLAFPFAKPRMGQEQLIESVKDGMKNKKPMLFQAPTGLGKTIGILYPSLVESLKRGQKTIYLTPKNSQHLVALSAVKHLQQTSKNMTGIVLTAKKKICMKAEPMCNSEYCEFAENHYTKMTEHNLLAKLQKKKILTASVFKKIAKEYKVCPYELQMEMIANREAVICDYNYVFSPRATHSRVTKLRIAEKEKPNVVIDELHNLPVRGMDYYSSRLSVILFEKAIKEVNKIPSVLQKQFLKRLNECIAIIYDHAVPGKNAPHIIVVAPEKFTEQESLLRDFLTRYLESDVIINADDIVLNIYNYWAEFTASLEWSTSGREEFFTSYHPNPPAIKITCCNASEMLETSYESFNQVIGFSATLKPFDFYSHLAGLHTAKLKTEEFYSPFPRNNRKLIIIPQISSKYADRIRNYPRIAEVITKITALKKGNYFAFFPSFDFMDKVFKVCKPDAHFKLIYQDRGMRQEEVQKLLTLLANDDASHIIFGVQGSVLSEGIDYPGKLAIGAFIVGTPLPQYDWEREKMKEYYHSKYKKGEEYAYIYPAMAKAIQAAGRVIRSENDKGIIILMDNRFLQTSYHQCMPNDWFNTSPQEIISTSILKDINDFWYPAENS